jgi:hypothetical protein
VGGNPRFIITGLYPPTFGTTPQEVSVWGRVINIVAYVFVALLLIVPIIFIIRRVRAKPAVQNVKTNEDDDEDDHGDVPPSEDPPHYDYV